MDGDGVPEFGPLLRRRRREAGLSQEALAERAALSARAISDVERGITRSVRPGTARALADALGLEGAPRSAFLRAARGPALAGIDRPRPSPVPKPTSPLVGRRGELEAVGRLLAGEARLVTLTGAGGVGKTRLAIELGHALGGGFPDGARFVDLSPLTDPELVASAVAWALGVEEAGGAAPEERLVAHLASRRVLLILDNFEQVLPAAPLAAALLGRCPALRVLVTSRVPLRIRGEHVVPVPPLRLPTEAERRSPLRVARCEAVALFVARARAADPRFALTPGNAAAVAEICARLDGLPLAIELAAARAGHLPVEAIRARLGSRFDLLAGGPPDLPPRQRTMWRAIQWSDELLTAGQRALFRRLAVFAGGFALEAAEWVAGEGGCVAGGADPRPATCRREPATDRPQPLALLGALVDHGLVRRVDEGEDEPRFDLFETVRAYGWSRLEAEGEAAAARSAHAAYVLDLVERAAPELTGPRQAGWLARLEAEHGNLRTALEWGLAGGDPDLAVRLAGRLWWFWEVRSHFAEGRRWLERALAAPGAGDGLGRAAALLGAGVLAFRQGDLAAAGRRLEEALAASRALGDRAGAAYACSFLAMAAKAAGDLDRAAAWLDEGLALFEALDDHVGVGGTLSIAGEVDHAWGNLDRADARFRRAIEVAGAIDHRLVVARTLVRLGQVALDRGDRAAAAQHAADALRLFAALRDRRGIAASLEGVAAALASERPVLAARLAGAADRLRSELGAPAAAADAGRLGRALAVAHDRLGATEIAAARAAGAATGPDEAVAEALAATDPGEAHPPCDADGRAGVVPAPIAS